MGGLLLGGRGRLTSAAHRRKAIELISEAHTAGAGLVSACSEIGICLRTLKRWRHRLTAEERQRILLTCNQPQYAALPPSQIVPDLADQGIFIGSESSFYRVLHEHDQVHRRGRKPAVSGDTEVALRAHLEKYPDATVLERRAALGLQCSEKTLWQTLRKMGWRYKKSRREP